MAYNIRLPTARLKEFKDKKQTPKERIMLVCPDYVWDEN